MCLMFCCSSLLIRKEKRGIADSYYIILYYIILYYIILYYIILYYIILYYIILYYIIFQTYRFTELVLHVFILLALVVFEGLGELVLVEFGTGLERFYNTLV